MNLHKSNKDVKKTSNCSVGLSRRNFIAAGAAGLIVPFIIPRCVMGGADHKAPSDQLTIACVGVGGMGRNYLEGCAHERIEALCDLDHNLVNERGVFKKYPDARRYHDYREMLDKEAQNFDALIIAVPDHHHTILLMAAMQLGKHIYCAKPITHTISEARKVKSEILNNSNLVTKASIQDSATNRARSTTELLNSGAIGPIREVHVWTNHPIYPCSLTRPPKSETPPKGMDWDIWIGPAPLRPFHSTYHPENWRPWWDFGSGTVGDMACHSFHMFFNELQLKEPSIVYGNGSTRFEGFFKNVLTPECQSNANMVTWVYPSRGNLPPLNLHWYDGGMKPHRPQELSKNLMMPRAGILFVGEKGKLISGYYGGNPFGLGNNEADKIHGLDGGLLLPEDKFVDFIVPEKNLIRCEKTNHYKEWTEACKTGEKTICPVEFGCEMTEVALLGAMALRSGNLINWDSKNMQVLNDKNTNYLVDPPYRRGWSL